MTIQAKIEADLVQALKDKKEFDCSVLRMIKSALHNKEIEKKSELKDEDVSEILRHEIKSRKDSVTDYEKGGRKDLADKEKKEIVLIEKYLPAMLGEEEIKKVVLETVKALNAGPKDFGKVMGQAMGKLKGKADGNTVSQIVKKALNQ